MISWSIFLKTNNTNIAHVRAFIINLISINYLDLVSFRKKMRKTTIKACFCFLNRAVWFINSSSLLRYWFLNSKVKNEDDTTNDDEHFILERQTIVCSCMDCFRFQVSISSDENFSCLTNVNCRFVKKDLSEFDDTFNDDIFVGDHQFVVSRYFQLRE